MKNNERLMSLDTLRGFDMFFIMGLSGLIVNLCALFPGGFSEMLSEQMSHVSQCRKTDHDYTKAFRFILVHRKVLSAGLFDVQDFTDLIHSLFVGVKSDYVIADLRVLFFGIDGDQPIHLIFNGSVFSQDGGEQFLFLPLGVDGDHVWKVGF